MSYQKTKKGHFYYSRLCFIPDSMCLLQRSCSEKRTVIFINGYKKFCHDDRFFIHNVIYDLKVILCLKYRKVSKTLNEFHHYFVMTRPLSPPFLTRSWQSSQAKRARITMATKTVLIPFTPTHTHKREERNADRCRDIPWKRLLWAWMERALIFFCITQWWLNFKDTWSWPPSRESSCPFLLRPTRKAIQTQQIVGGKTIWLKLYK